MDSNLVCIMQHSRAFSRTLTRLLLALLLVTCLTIVFLGKCGLNLDRENDDDDADDDVIGGETGVLNVDHRRRRRGERGGTGGFPGAARLGDVNDSGVKRRHPRGRGVVKEQRRHAKFIEVDAASAAAAKKGLQHRVASEDGAVMEKEDYEGLKDKRMMEKPWKVKPKMDESLLQLQENQQLQQQTDHLQHLLAQREELHRGEIVKLRQQIEALRQQIADQSPVNSLPKNVRKLGGDAEHDFHNFVRQAGIEGPPPPQMSLFDEQRLVNAKLDINKFVDERLAESEILHGQAMRTEYEVIPYNRFTLTRLFLVDPGLGRRVVEKPIGLRKKEIQQVVAKGVEILNHHHVLDDDDDSKNNINNNKNNIGLDEMLQHTFVTEDFMEGIFRTEPGVGTHYELYFRSPEGAILQEQPLLPDRPDDQKNKSAFYSEGDVMASQTGREYGLGGAVGGGGGGKGVGGGASTLASASVSDSKLKKVALFRPFAPLQLVKNPLSTSGTASASSSTSSSLASSSSTKNNKPWINLILPLSGRIDKFRSFMEKFVRICVKDDKRVYLTVVYFGEAGLKEVTGILRSTSKRHAFKSLKLVTVSDSRFSRGKALQVGVEAWASGGGGGGGGKGGEGGAIGVEATVAGPSGSDVTKNKDVLIFLCDVDIIFNADFLERCRQNASPGEKVYYPILFSLYNPNIVYSLHDVPIPPELEQLVISKDTGWWRDFGYGMTCQYRSDFLAVKGFDEEIQGWGGEDVALYRKYVKSTRKVIRAVDPGIFHTWHEKNCDPNLSADQYRNCIRSKALNEASHAQLGLLAFKDEIDIHRSYLKKDELKNIPQNKISR